MNKRFVFVLSLLTLLAIMTISMLTASPNVEAQDATPQPTSTQLPVGAPPAGRPDSMQQTSSLVPAFADLAYASLSDAQKLDIYLPEGMGPFPLVIFVHGGAFKMGDKAMGVSDFEPIVAAGYAVASLNYRLSGEALYPAQIQDVKAAVRFLRANADEYQLDPDHFAAWGASAGGNLVAMMGTSGDVAEFDDPELGNADVSSCVQAVVDWFGPTDFGLMDAQFAASGVCDSSAQSHDAANSPESLLLGEALPNVPELVQAANPLTYISDDDPPFLIQHGTADCNVPTQQSQILYDALMPVIGEENATLILMEGAGHGGTAFSDAANMELVIAFLDQHLKEKP